MRIVIATGIYPPAVGGPAYYAQSLCEEFEQLGHTVRIATYAWDRHLPTGIRHLVFAIRNAYAVWRADVVVTLDQFSVGVPIIVLKNILRTKCIVRTGGDFLWEHYIERTGDGIPLPHFYKAHPKFTYKEHIIFRLIQWVVKNTDVLVFSSKWQRDIWESVYVFPERVVIIENYMGPKRESFPPPRKNVVWYTRDIILKNGDRLREAIDHTDLILDHGRVSQSELHDIMARAYIVALPSLSEVTPNYILEALQCNKPCIMTQYSGYADMLRDHVVLVDPLDVEDIRAKFCLLADDSEYQKQVARASEFNREHSYADIAHEYIALCE